MRTLSLACGALAWLVAMATAVFAVCFFGNVLVARTVDGTAWYVWGEPLAVDVVLLTGLALQHWALSRPTVRRRVCWWLGPTFERSIFLVVTSISVLTVFVFWQPIGGVVWEYRHTFVTALIHGIYCGGWSIAIAASMTSPLAAAGAARLHVDGLYGFVRQPAFAGLLLVLWAAPVMTVGRLVFAVTMTIYMLVATLLLERDLASCVPEFRQYQRKVPMLLPSWRQLSAHGVRTEA